MKTFATASIVAIVLLASTLATRTATAADSFFDIFTELSVNSPPYPGADIITVVGTNFGSNFQATQSHVVSLAECSLQGAPVPSVCKGGGGGGGGGAAGTESFHEMTCALDVPQLTSGRNIRDIRIVHPPGTPPGTWRLVPVNPAAPPFSAASFFDVFVDASFFDITYRVADDTGEHTFHIHGTSPSGRMSFFDVFCELKNPVPDALGHIDSFFDVFVDFQMVGPQPPAGTSDMECRTTGYFDGGPTATSPASWGAIKGRYR